MKATTTDRDELRAGLDDGADLHLSLSGDETLSATMAEEKRINAQLEADDDLAADFGTIQKVSTSNYEDLYNKPKIEGVTLIGDKTYDELGLPGITAQEIDDILFGGD